MCVLIHKTRIRVFMVIFVVRRAYSSERRSLVLVYHLRVLLLLKEGLLLLLQSTHLQDILSLNNLPIHSRIRMVSQRVLMSTLVELILPRDVNTQTVWIPSIVNPVWEYLSVPITVWEVCHFSTFLLLVIFDWYHNSFLLRPLNHVRPRLFVLSRP